MIHCDHPKDYPSHDWCRACAEAHAGAKPTPKFKTGDYVSVHLTGWGVMRVASSKLVLAGMATDNPNWWVEYKLIGGDDGGVAATSYESNLRRYIKEEDLVKAKDLLREARILVDAWVDEYGSKRDLDLLKRIDEFLESR